MRNMQEIMKLRLLQPMLQAKADEVRAEFTKSIEDDLKREYWAAPFSMMEHADNLFKKSCEHKLWAFLARHVERVIDIRTRALNGETFEAEVAKRAGIVMDPVTAMDVTVQDLRDWAFEEFRFLSPLPRSTSMSHNICEAQMLQVVMDFQRDRLGFWTFQRRAQHEDYEYLEWEAEQVKRAKAERERQAADDALKEQRAKEARRGVKKLVETVAGPHLKNKDALIGWPTLQDALRIRNDKLRAYVTKVHDAYRLVQVGTVTDIVAQPPVKV